MTTPQWLTIATIWVAFGCYAVSIACMLCERWTRTLTALWQSGVVMFWTHVVLAFASFYDWSMSIAYAKTLSQTAEVTGWHSGMGLYANFLFGAVWSWDATCLSRGSVSYRSRPPMVRYGVHGFLAFMFFNGTAVFGNGPVRWLGLGVTACLVGVAIYSHSSRTAFARTDSPPSDLPSGSE